MPRLVGLDFGLSRIGIALSDPTQFLATPLCALKTASSLEKSAFLLSKELESHFPLEAIILGLPIHMNGKESPLSQTVRLFAKELEKIMELPVILWDERLTTAQSERMLKDEAQLTRKARARCIDAVAATAILQNYMDTHSTQEFTARYR